MSNEQDIRKLLKIRADLEDRVEQLQVELDDLKVAISQIDKAIVGGGFQQPNSQSEGFQAMKMPAAKPAEKPFTTLAAPKLVEVSTPEPVGDGSSIQAKDGTILGRVQQTDDSIIFTPSEGLSFMITTPPFQSFLLDRVLANMRTTDESRAATGEITPEQVLSFNVEVEGDIIKSLAVRNCGGDRRLREIQSSLRWSLDKMYDKSRRG